MTVIRSVELADDRHRPAGAADVRIREGRVVEVGAGLDAGPDEEVVDGGGGALLPGLHDHHVHLFASGAMAASVLAGPPDVRDEDGLVGALAAGAARVDRLDRGGWVRAVGYHESVAGPLDAARLDRWLPGRPVRVQDRSGICWTLSTAALAGLPLDEAPGDGVERDAAGRATGRLFRLDRWLRRHLPPTPVDLAGVGHAAASRGVTGFTDADPRRDGDAVERLADAHRRGDLPQRLTLMGPPGLAVPAPLAVGPVKVLLDDDRLPALADLARGIAAAHDEGRPVAVHCVTRLQLVLLLAALDEAGTAEGDRIEHGAVVPGELVGRIAELGLTVVTQPNLVAERGDRYRLEVAAEDQPDLWRVRSLLDAGVKVAGGTDAPHGHPDPWRAIAGAVDRMATDGEVLGPDERVDGAAALDLFLGSADDPSRPRRVEVGMAADLCLLRVGHEAATTHPAAASVVATWVGGHRVWPPDGDRSPHPNG